jgi:hypothetical protein
MSPLHFSIDELVRLSPREFAIRLLVLDQWRSFPGHGTIPAIKSATFENRSPAITGSAIRLTLGDDSTCLATVVEWHPNYRLAIKVTDFTPPLSDSIASIDETWDVEPENGQTKVTRLVQILPKPESRTEAVAALAMDLKKAMLLHLHQLKESATPDGTFANGDPEMPELLNDPHQAPE